MRRFAVLSTVVFSLLISANAWGVAPSTYNITDLGPGAATAINSAGQVAGYTGSPQAYLWSQGTTTPLGTLGGSYSQALAINDNGLVVGQADVSDGNFHAFSYDSSMHDLGTLGADASTAYGVNITGQVVGGSNYEAFLYDGTMHNLGTLGGNDSGARDINASGTIVGWSYLSGGPEHAFIYSGGSMHDMGTLPGGNYASALAVNAVGQATGNALNSADVYRAFLYNGTAMQDLGTLADFDNSWGIGINDNDEVVGQCDDQRLPLSRDARRGRNDVRPEHAGCQSRRLVTQRGGGRQRFRVDRRFWNDRRGAARVPAHAHARAVHPAVVGCRHDGCAGLHLATASTVVRTCRSGGAE